LSIEIKQEELEIVDYYQSSVILKISDNDSIKQKGAKKTKSIKEKKILKEEKEEQKNPQQGQSGILSK
jgi:hypothetical protein